MTRLARLRDSDAHRIVKQLEYPSGAALDDRVGAPSREGDASVAAFRGHYGDDLVEHFADMVSDRGVRAAWTRTALDLLVTVPRYRLESIMNEQHAGTTLNIAITLLVGGGVLTFFTGTYPGLVLVVAALAIAFAQRSTLARAIRTPDPDLRLRRLGSPAS